MAYDYNSAESKAHVERMKKLHPMTIVLVDEVEETLRWHRERGYKITGILKEPNDKIALFFSKIDKK